MNHMDTRSSWINQLMNKKKEETDLDFLYLKTSVKQEATVDIQ